MSDRTKSSGILLFGVPGMIVGLMASWVFSNGGLSSVRAQEIPRPYGAVETGSQGAAADTIALTVATPGGGTRLVLIDTREKAFAIYRMETGTTKAALKLEAARQYNWDLMLSDYNNLPPEPKAIRSTVESKGVQ